MEFTEATANPLPGRFDDNFAMEIVPDPPDPPPRPILEVLAARRAAERGAESGPPLARLYWGCTVMLHCNVRSLRPYRGSLYLRKWE